MWGMNKEFREASLKDLKEAEALPEWVCQRNQISREDLGMDIMPQESISSEDFRAVMATFLFEFQNLGEEAFQSFTNKMCSSLRDNKDSVDKSVVAALLLAGYFEIPEMKQLFEEIFADSDVDTLKEALLNGDVLIVWAMERLGMVSERCFEGWWDPKLGDGLQYTIHDKGSGYGANASSTPTEMVVKLEKMVQMLEYVGVVLPSPHPPAGQAYFKSLVGSLGDLNKDHFRRQERRPGQYPRIVEPPEDWSPVWKDALHRIVAVLERTDVTRIYGKTLSVRLFSLPPLSLSLSLTLTHTHTLSSTCFLLVRVFLLLRSRQ
eukprot:m.405289 g.405289  ORF g.405289 m.405289 type:complete len:320 (-) comp16794_c3_seq54:1645-2604(-)